MLQFRFRSPDSEQQECYTAADTAIADRDCAADTDSVDTAEPDMVELADMAVDMIGIALYHRLYQLYHLWDCSHRNWYKTSNRSQADGCTECNIS